MGARNNYGQVNDAKCLASVLTGAALAFKAASGKFVTGYGGALVIAIPQALGILGWAEVGEFTTATTDKITVNTSFDAIYEMPTDAALTIAILDALVGKTIDVIVTGGIQYADYNASTDDTLQVMGYGYYGPSLGEQTLFVRMNDKTCTKTTA